MIGHAEKVWLLLVGLTLTGAWLAETGKAGWSLTLIVAFLIGLKSRIVIEYYMEMRFANKRIRLVLLVFITLIPLLVIVSHGWGDIIQQFTTIN